MPIQMWFQDLILAIIKHSKYVHKYKRYLKTVILKVSVHYFEKCEKEFVCILFYEFEGEIKDMDLDPDLHFRLLIWIGIQGLQKQCRSGSEIMFFFRPPRWT